MAYAKSSNSWKKLEALSSNDLRDLVLDINEIDNYLRDLVLDTNEIMRILMIANEILMDREDILTEDQFRNDVEADADTLASAGYGTDEDYGYFGGEDF